MPWNTVFFLENKSTMTFDVLTWEFNMEGMIPKKSDYIQYDGSVYEVLYSIYDIENKKVSVMLKKLKS